MDPKVCGKLLTTHGEGDDDDDEGLRDGSPSRNRLQDGISTGTEGCGGGTRVFSAVLMFSGYVGIYRKEGAGGQTGCPRGRGRAL